MKGNLWLVVNIGIAVLLMACTKNKQDFTYAEMNEVSIETADSSFVVTQLDTLSVKVTLHESMPAGDEYTYEWAAYSSAAAEGTKPLLLSKEKDLKAEINLSPGGYKLRYTVTSKKTGIASLMLYSLTVNGAFYEGWLVAGNKDGRAMLSFIREDNEVFLQPAEDVNHVSYPGRALAVQAGINYYMGLINYFTDQGVFRFNANDFLQNGSTPDFFPQGATFSGMPAYAVSKLSTDQFIVNNGGLYAGIGPTFYPAEVLKPYSDRFPGDYSLFPAVIPSAQLFTYFYDNKYRRFMQVSYGDREITVSPANESATFNPAMVGKKMIAYDRGVAAYSEDEFYFVMEDSNGRYIYSLSGASPQLAQKMENSPELMNATAFATSGVLKHLYYGAGNHIYLYDIAANAARLLYTFPDGCRIKDLKMDRTTSKRIVVGVTAGTAGEVYYFDLNNIGNIVGNTYANKFTGFGDIVQLTYRNTPSL